jgi:uncharacterized SAM-binding protein YcdF (DUF218 family)
MAEIAVAFGVPRSAILQEPDSLNTYQNAVNVNALMAQEGIERVLLVTSAMHMPRALGIFMKLGIPAIAAPTDFIVSSQTVAEIGGTRQAVMLSLLPDAANLALVSRALKEYLGLVVYRLRGWV